MPARDPVVVAAVRTPLGRRGGKLSGTRPDELLAAVLQAVIHTASVPAGMVEEVIVGCVTQIAEQGGNIARLGTLLAGFPVDVPAYSVNRMCSSSEQAVHAVAHAIRAGSIDIGVAAGVESMSQVPMFSDSPCPNPQLLARFDLVSQGESAEMIAQGWGLGRDELDRYALDSHRKAHAATEGGQFRAEMVDLTIHAEGNPGAVVDRDEGIRPDTSLEKMSRLASAFVPDGMITAGNSSSISDGAAAALLMSAERAAQLGLVPLARLVGTACVGVDPVLMLHGPIAVTRKLLSRCGLSLAQMDLIEINEAFASVVLAWAKELDADLGRVNVNGGAIALGHPLGASGVRITATLLHELSRRRSRYGLQTMCAYHGMATATIWEAVH